MSWQIHSFTSDSLLVEELAADISRHLQAAIDSRGQASLAVSGGRTPLLLFDRLSAAVIEWQKVTVTLVDERWVDEDHPDSNASLVKSCLLKGPAVRARFLGLKTPQADPFSAVDQVERALGSLPLPLDVVVLGMGLDGHTASFFPAARGVDQALDPATARLCSAVEPTTAPHPRITLTLPVILAARRLYLHIVGPGKKKVLDQATATGVPADTKVPGQRQLPIGTVLQQSPGAVQIYYAENGVTL
jgi:6-phosphogluconolactonase